MSASPRATLRQLELFVAAADRGSFAAAATAMHLTPNAVAQAIGELESTLNAQLCVRHRARGLTLTPAGRQLLERARPLLRDAAELERSLGGGGSLAGPVVVGCYSTLAPTVLPPLLQEAGRRHPELDLQILDGTLTDLLPRLAEGELDLLVTYAARLPQDLRRVTLGTVQRHVLLPADHRLAGETAVALEELAGEPLILLDIPPSGDNTLESLRMAGVEARVGHRTSNFELVRSLVARGLGYGLMFQRPTIDVSYEGRALVTRPLADPLPMEELVMAWPTAMPLTERALAVVELAQELNVC